MSRKQKTSFVEDLFDLVALLPWWGRVILAVVSYFVLHAFATPDPPQPINIHQVGAGVVRMLWKTLATGGTVFDTSAMPPGRRRFR